MFEFLYKIYFFKVIFELFYLFSEKIFLFVNIFELLRFEKSQERLHLSAKHRKKIEKILIPTHYQKLNAFL